MINCFLFCFLFWIIVSCYFFFVCCLFEGCTVAYGGSQPRGLIGAVAAGLHRSHSNVGSELCL